MSNKHLNRRDFVRAASLAGAGIILPSFGIEPTLIDTTRYKAKAKAVIDIWLWGGPAHIDTFDPKPRAGKDFCGPLDKIIKTKSNAIQLNATMPQLAEQADKFSLIRSLTHGVNAHETASYFMRTGRQSGQGLVYPSVGAIMSYLKGYGNGYEGLIPPYIALTNPQGRFSESGFLGQQYKPFATGGDPSKTPFAVAGIIAKGITDDRQRQRRELLHELDTLSKAMPENETFKKSDTYEKEAYELILGDARKVFDLSEETKGMRERYGMNKFGQSCLAARRLIEKGVLYVTINYKGWDTHKQHFNSMNRMLPELDQGLAALLQDLSDKDMLDQTLVSCSGEFGRTPKVQWAEPWNGGRSHFGRCFSGLVAGGGFIGGKVVGESDSTGSNVVSRPVYPQDYIGSIYQLLGINPDGPLPNPRGMKIPLLPKGKGRLDEIIKA